MMKVVACDAECHNLKSPFKTQWTHYLFPFIKLKKYR